MNVTSISEAKLTQQETLTLIEAIESDFSVAERVLIKADWVMQNTLQKLQDNQFNEQSRTLLIEQLSGAIASVENELYQYNQQVERKSPSVA